MEINRKDFRSGGSGATALAESIVDMNKWLKENTASPINIETLTENSPLGFGVTATKTVGVRLWYSSDV